MREQTWQARHRDATIHLHQGQYSISINGEHQGTTGTLRDAKALVPDVTDWRTA